MTTVLVTGGAGFIATHTDIELLDKGYDVISVDNYGNSSPVALERVEQITGKPVKRYDGDVRDEALMERVFTENTSTGSFTSPVSRPWASPWPSRSNTTTTICIRRFCC